MHPVRYPGQFSRPNRKNEFAAKFHPEPELLDECANQEAPSSSDTIQYVNAADQENTVSSGYFSGASSNQPFYGESLTHGTVNTIELPNLLPSKRNVHFSDEILPPAFKRLNRRASPTPNRQVLREIQVAYTEMEEINAPKPSLTRSATVPFPSPMLTDFPSHLPEKPKSVLPVVKTSTHGSELVSIHTVAQLVRGEYEKLNVTHTIIDCRYPYEYEAGHIRGAINLYTSSEVVKEVFKKAPAASFNVEGSFMDLGPTVDESLKGQNPAIHLPPIRNYMVRNDILDSDDSDDSLLEEKRLEEAQRQLAEDANVPVIPVPEAYFTPPTHVIIFHCEFSSQRGPELSRFLRKVDRYINYPRYPFVFYPNVYVMLGGYAAFFKEYPELCEPRGYLRMFERGFKSDLRYYSKLTKHVSNACGACFKNSKLVNLRLSPSMTKEEKRPTLRSVQTMLPGSHLQSMENLFENSIGKVIITTPKKHEGVSRQYLQLAEHIIRRGDHIRDAYEYFRQTGTGALTKEMLVDLVPAESTENRPLTTFSLKPRLSFSSDDDFENRLPPPSPPSDSRQKAVLDFSDIDESTDTSGYL